MLKLSAAYSKKVPAETDFSSQSYHASVEVELPDGLSHEALNAKIHETFALVRDSVEAELRNTVRQPSAASQTPPTQSQPGLHDTPPQNSSQPVYGKKNGTASDAPASPKQVKYLLDLARQFGITPEQIKAKFNVPSLESMTKVQCSHAIDQLNGKAA